MGGKSTKECVAREILQIYRRILDRRRMASSLATSSHVVPLLSLPPVVLNLIILIQYHP